MAFYSEKILDDTVEGEKPLGLASRFESAYLPFPLAGGLMRAFGAIVAVTFRVVSHIASDHPQGGRVASQFVIAPERPNRDAEIQLLGSRTSPNRERWSGQYTSAPITREAGQTDRVNGSVHEIFRSGEYPWHRRLMIRPTNIIITLAVLGGVAMAASLKLTDLPAPAQKTVQDTLTGGEIKNISKEVEKGITQYEVETMLNGKHRDFSVDAKGALIVVEDEVALDSIPASAKAAIIKKVGSGKLRMVEVVKYPGKDVLYEAAYTSKAGKKHEVLVTARGTETKD